MEILNPHGIMGVDKSVLGFVDGKQLASIFNLRCPLVPSYPSNAKNSYYTWLLRFDVDVDPDRLTIVSQINKAKTRPVVTSSL